MAENQENLPAENRGPKAVVLLDPKTGGLMPKDMDGLWRISCIMADSGLVPKDFAGNPNAVFTATQFGFEVGLSPMQAVQNIASINGRPAIWGDAQLALIRASGLLEDFDEYFLTADGDKLGRHEILKKHYLGDNVGDFRAVCMVKRKDEPREHFGAFSIDDARAAGVWIAGQKNVGRMESSPWFRFPLRMLKARARSDALRDKFPDVLKGLSSREALIGEPVDITPDASGAYKAEADNLTEAIREAKKAEPETVPEPDDGKGSPASQDSENSGANKKVDPKHSQENKPAETSSDEIDLWAEFRKSWIHTRAESTFVDILNRYATTVKECKKENPDLFAELLAKWEKVSGGKDFPIEDEVEGDHKETQAEWRERIKREAAERIEEREAAEAEKEAARKAAEESDPGDPGTDPGDPGTAVPIVTTFSRYKEFQRLMADRPALVAQELNDFGRPSVCDINDEAELSMLLSAINAKAEYTAEKDGTVFDKEM